MGRFLVLDSWRGIAACLVALFHLDAYSHLYAVPFLRNSWLFVDFFFVLSGFVIAANYQQRLRDGTTSNDCATASGWDGFFSCGWEDCTPSISQCWRCLSAVSC